MSNMLAVRSAHAPAPSTFTAGPSFRACRVCAAAGPDAFLPPAHIPCPASYALPSTRQHASTFNQPLSFDTSSVTDMRFMFNVRSAHAPAPPALKAGPSSRACRVCAAAGPPPPGRHLAPRRTPSFRLGRARRRSTSR
eukprot:scaffold9391_cov52-Phaeocystis_antarctica.AAC.1